MSPSKTAFFSVFVHRLINITLLPLVQAIFKGSRRPSSFIRTHAPATRAIGVTHTACKGDELRRYLLDLTAGVRIFNFFIIYPGMNQFQTFLTNALLIWYHLSLDNHRGPWPFGYTCRLASIIVLPGTIVYSLSCCSDASRGIRRSKSHDVCCTYSHAYERTTTATLHYVRDTLTTSTSLLDRLVP